MTDLAFEPDALRDRYRAERDKRIRADGNQQYTEVAGAFAHYVEDPYVDGPVERPRLTDEVDVVVVGGGFGGLLAGARLREQGVESIRLIEKGGDVGGTWYWNRYPGAMCDVESYIYMPLLEEVGYVPTEKYAHAAEILEHSRAIARHYNLYEDACFQTEVTELRWDEATNRWEVMTNRDDCIRARFVVMSSGPLHRPKLPGIDGIADYDGHSFHTSRWDYDYTGGSPNGNLDRLSDVRVGVIGTGATAVQAVPHLAEAAKELYVFQRTPSSVDVRDNRPTEQAWAESLEPGWQARRMENFNNLVTGRYEPEDLVNDGWTDIIGNLMARLSSGTDNDMSPEGLAATLELADFEKMEQIRSRVDQLIQDPEVAEALKPWYRQFCKRPCFHDDYLDSFNRPNVHLVDTEGKGVDRITEDGIVVGDRHYELDCIIYATGFEVGTSYTRRSGFEVVGTDGLTLSEKWDSGVSTLHGMHSRGFPNCFFVSHVQGAFFVNYPHMLDMVSTHLGHIIGHALGADITRIEVTEEAEESWVQTIVDKSQDRQGFLEECTPGYYNNEGRPGERVGQDTSYGDGPAPFIELLEAWRDAGTFEGLDLA